MRTKQINPALLQLYIRGKCSRQQLTIVRQYLADAAYRESLETFLQSDWQNAMNEKGPVSRNEEQYRQFLAAVQAAGDHKPQGLRRKLLPYRRWVAAAAIIILVSLAGFLWWANDRSHGSHTDLQWLSISNEAGERTAFFLPDSSKVYLGAASSLAYNTGYGISNRELRLNGEAYFIVHHEGDHPFAVTTGKLTTVDIGTEFNIRFLRNSPSIEVAVAKGSVEVLNNEGRGKKIATLSGQQLLRFDTASHSALIDTLPGEEIGGWRKGLLVFRKQTFGEVAAELERFYGLHIGFDNPAHARILITTTLEHADAGEALEIIALTAGVKTERKGSEVRIY